jgi:hypothetical protein
MRVSVSGCVHPLQHRRERVGKKKSWLATACKPARLFLTLRQLSTDNSDDDGGGECSGVHWTNSMTAQNSSRNAYTARDSHTDNSWSYMDSNRSCTDSNRIGNPDSQIRLQRLQRQP